MIWLGVLFLLTLALVIGRIWFVLNDEEHWYALRTAKENRNLRLLRAAREAEYGKEGESE